MIWFLVQKWDGLGADPIYALKPKANEQKYEATSPGKIVFPRDKARNTNLPKNL